MMLGLLVALLLLGLYFVAFRSSEHAVTASVVIALTVSTLFPSFTPTATERAIAVLGSTFLLALAYLRAERGDRDRRWPPGSIIFIAFVITTSIANAVGGDAERISIMLSQGALMIMLLITAMRLTERGRWTVLLVLGGLGALQFAVAFGEEFLGTPAVWSRVNGTDDINSRPNYFTDAIAGRALGTTSMMITLGAFSGASLLASLKLGGRGRRLLWLVVASLSGTTIFFSGTRSAVIALGIAMIFWIFFTWKSYKRLFAILGLALISLTAAQFDVSALFGFENFENSISFIHRTGVISSIGVLLDMPNGVMFGHGGVGASELLHESLGGASGVPAFDNTYVRELAVSGLLGLLLLLAFLIRVVFSAPTMSKVFIVFFVAMGMSFDLFTWNLMCTLITLTVAGALAPEPRTVRHHEIVRSPYLPRVHTTTTIRDR